jgi:Terminase large subunit, T4likevirus-type, N-terminal
MASSKPTSSYIFDESGALGPKYRVYRKTGSELVCITPVGFPHARQIDYFESRVPYTLWGGMRGSGKTYGAVWDNLFTAYNVPGCPQIIFRKTMGELRRTMIAEFLKLPEDLRGRFTDSQTSPRLELDNGSTIHFASVNDEAAARKYLSGEFLKVTFDEWAELPFAWWSFITGSARSTISKDVYGRPVSAQIKGLTNPGGIGADDLRHMFGTDCEKSRPKHLDIEYDPNDYLFIPSIMDDNPAYSADTPAGRAYRKMLTNQPKAIREAWLHGRWTGFEGMYFDCFDRELVPIPHDTLLRLMRQQYWQPIFMGIDWGQVHYAAINWNTLLQLPMSNGETKTFVVTFGEATFKGLSERALAEEIVDHTKMLLGEGALSRVTKVYLSPETFGHSIRSRARAIGDVFASHGMVRPIAAKTEKNSRENGLRHMYQLLSERHKLLDGWTTDNVVTGWFISTQCPDILGAIPWAVSDPKKDGDIEKEGSAFQLDILDAIRYAVYSHYVATDQPAEDVYRERMKIMSQGGVSPSASLRLFCEHTKRMREAKQTQDGKFKEWQRRRHPRTNTQKGDDLALVTGSFAPPAWSTGPRRAPALNRGH